MFYTAGTGGDEIPKARQGRQGRRDGQHRGGLGLVCLLVVSSSSFLLLLFFFFLSSSSTMFLYSVRSTYF